jgi:hypothetical protein
VLDNRESQSGNKSSIARFGSITVKDCNPMICERTGAEIASVHARFTFKVRRFGRSWSKRNGSTNKPSGACAGTIAIATRFLHAGIAVIRDFARGFMGGLRIDVEPCNDSQLDSNCSILLSKRPYPQFLQSLHEQHDEGESRSGVWSPVAGIRVVVRRW